MAVNSPHLVGRWTSAPPPDQLLGAPAVLDEVGHRHHLEPVRARSTATRSGHAGHGAVVVHDLADDPGRVEPRQAGQVDRRLGLPGALQHAARARPQREDVARLHQVLGAAARVDGHLDGAGPVGGRDAGGDALPRLDGYREGGAEARLVVAASWGAAAALSARSAVRARQISPRPCLAMKLMASGVTNWAAMVRSPSFSRSSSSHDDHHAARLDLVEGLLDGGEWPDSVFLMTSPLRLRRIVEPLSSPSRRTHGAQGTLVQTIPRGPPQPVRLARIAARAQGLPHVAGQHVRLEVHPPPRADRVQRRLLQRVRDDAQTEIVVADVASPSARCRRPRSSPWRRRSPATPAGSDTRNLPGDPPLSSRPGPRPRRPRARAPDARPAGPPGPTPAPG